MCNLLQFSLHYYFYLDGGGVVPDVVFGVAHYD